MITETNWTKLRFLLLKLQNDWKQVYQETETGTLELRKSTLGIF